MNVKMEGPSPLVPSIFLVVLGMLIYGSNLLSIFDVPLSFFQMVSEAEEKSLTTLILVILVVLVFMLIYLPSSFPFFGGNKSPFVNSNPSHGYDELEFGFGTLLLVLLFILLYNII